MAIEKRLVTLLAQWAKNALTDIPVPPVSGTAYRNPGLSAEDIGGGQAYDRIYDSARYNQFFYEISGLVQQIEKYGIPPYSDLTDYETKSICLWTDGKLYQAKIESGPNKVGGSKEPTDEDAWEVFSGGGGEGDDIDLSTLDIRYMPRPSGVDASLPGALDYFDGRILAEGGSWMASYWSVSEFTESYYEGVQRIGIFPGGTDIQDMMKNTSIVASNKFSKDNNKARAGFAWRLMADPPDADDWKSSTIYTRSDGSYVIMVSDLPFHVPESGVYADLHASVAEYASENPDQVEEESYIQLTDAEKLEETIREYKKNTYLRLDEFARQRRYDNIYTAHTYAGSSNPEYASEGQYCQSASIATWEVYDRIINSVKSGEREMPGTWEEFEEELPLLSWPDGNPNGGLMGIPIRGILAWDGDIDNIPTGFVLCDGNNDTKDLRDKFIVGAGNSYSAGDTGSVGVSGTLQFCALPLIMRYGAASEGGEETGPGTVVSKIFGGARLESYINTLSADNPNTTWSIISGTLPLGIHMIDNGDGTATISGTLSDDVGYYSSVIRASTSGFAVDYPLEIAVGTMLFLTHLDSVVTSGSDSFIYEVVGGVNSNKISGTSTTINTSTYKIGSGSLEIPTGISSSVREGIFFSRPYALSATDEYTFDFWCNPQSMARTSVIFANANDYGTSTGFLIVLSTAGDLRIAYTSTSNTTYAYTTPLFDENNRLQIGNWYHVEISKDSTGFWRIFVDGKLCAQSETLWNRASGPGYTYLGNSYSSGAPNCFMGFLDEFSITKGVVKNRRTFEPPLNESDYPLPASTLALKGSLPAGAAGETYTGTLTVVGEHTPIVSSIISGSLPGDWGMVVGDGVLTVSGGGVAAGNYTFTIAITDSVDKTVSLPLTVVIE